MIQIENQTVADDGIYYMGYASRSQNDPKDPNETVTNDEEGVVRSGSDNEQTNGNEEEEKNYNTLGGDLHIDMEDVKTEKEIY